MAGFTRWWGCVFSAHAEVVPFIDGESGDALCILRARGGSSHAILHAISGEAYSPRTRRYSGHKSKSDVLVVVFVVWVLVLGWLGCFT